MMVCSLLFSPLPGWANFGGYYSARSESAGFPVSFDLALQSSFLFSFLQCLDSLALIAVCAVMLPDYRGYKNIICHYPALR